MIRRTITAAALALAVLLGMALPAGATDSQTIVVGGSLNPFQTYWSSVSGQDSSGAHYVSVAKSYCYCISLDATIVVKFYDAFGNVNCQYIGYSTFTADARCTRPVWRTTTLIDVNGDGMGARSITQYPNR